MNETAIYVGCVLKLKICYLQNVCKILYLQRFLRVCSILALYLLPVRLLSPALYSLPVRNSSC